MTMFLAPYTAIADIDGSPLDAGFIYFGEFGKNPETHPIPVYWDADFAVPAAQPIRTRNGYPIRNGSPCKIYLKQAEHSLVVKNKNLSAILVEMNNKGISSSLLVRPDGNTVETSLAEIDAALETKASNEYVDNQVGLMAPQATTYSKSEVDSALSSKAPQATTYSKSEVDTKFSAYVGGRKGYTTLALAQADQANLAVNTVVDVTNDPVAENNGTYQWNGTTLTKSAYDPLTQAKADATTKADNAKFGAISQIISTSSNLYNDATSVKADKVISETGELIDAAGFAYSDFIGVKSDKDYYQDGFRHVAFYDSSKAFISRQSYAVVSSKVSGSFKTPVNAAYIRLSYRYNLSESNVVGRMLSSGATALPFEPYFAKLKNEIKVLKDPAWVFDASNLSAMAVTKEKTDFIALSKNLFNHLTVTPGMVILVDGIITANASYGISDFIAVVPGEQYTISSSIGTDAFVNIAYYSNSKVFTTRIDVRTYETPLTITIPANTYYLRFNYNQGTAEQNKRMFNRGATALPFELYKTPALDGVTLNPAEIEKIKQEIGGGNSPSEGYIKPNNNLFDHSTTTNGFSISNEGAITANASYGISDFIAVVPGEQYTISAETGYYAFTNIAYYDSSKVFLSRLDIANGSNIRTVTIPSNAKFVRFNINFSQGAANQRQRMFNKGAIALPFELRRIELSGVALANDVLDQVSKELQLNPDDNVMLDLPVDAVYSTDQTWPFITDFRNVTSAQVYQMFDTLMSEHPDYITKQALGNDAWGNPIALYKFTPTKPSAVAKTRYPKVFLTCGTHGMEHTPPMATYLMLYEMCKNWQSNPLLEALRFNVDFLILPVVNPSGWDKYSRVNDNGVDINRNFPEGWSLQGEGTDLYSGPSPLSELESQYVKQVFDENPDIDIMYDYHNFNGLPGWEHVIWVPTGSGAYVEHMCQMLVSRMTRKWRKEYSFIPSSETWFAGYSDTTHGAMIQDHARERGIKFSATFETAGKIWLDPEGGLYNTPHKKMCVEALVNWILINLNELKRI
ncbi:M14 family metallopeptidase [Acinetobacter indicus]|uniref:M14 family metallopeptidase n=1 Tax=Acinetobacter indicus TaxID=756892 RepID=UPI00257878E9|nr:M14 family metallopeptidase [Acinetobacter indicus]MDM1302017.1 DUF2817 domain-containing protein [Acinetobacter indicus]